MCLDNKAYYILGELKTEVLLFVQCFMTPFLLFFFSTHLIYVL